MPFDCLHRISKTETFLFLFIFLFTTINYSQTQKLIDSLKKQIHKTTNDSVYVALNIKTGQLVKNLNSNEAQFYFKQALDALGATYYYSDKNEQLVTCFNYLGSIERRKNNYNKALEYYFKELNINEQEKDSLKIGKTYHDISKLFSAQREYDKAIYYIKKALVLRKKDSSKYGSTLRNYGKLLYLIKDYDKALVVLDSAKLFSINNEIHLADIKTIYAKIYRTQNKLKESLSIFEEIANIYTKHKKNERKANVLIDLAMVNQKLNRNKIALQYLDTAEVIHQKFKNKKVLSNIFYERYTIFYKEKKYLKALENFTNHKKYSDSVFTAKKIVEVANIEHAYKIEKQEALKKTRIEANKKRLAEISKRHQVEKILYFVLFLLSLLSIIGLIFNYKNKKKVHLKNIQKKELESELLREKIVFLKYKVDKILAENKVRSDFKNELAERLKKIKKLSNSKDIVSKYQSLLIQIENQTKTEKRIDFTVNSSKIKDAGVELKINKKFPELTKSEREICYLLYLNLSTKEIINIRSTTESAIKSTRYRIRKKLQIPKNMELELFIQNSLN